MATAIQARQAQTPPRLRLRYDHIFFPGMAGVILVTVFLGFAQTYYLSGVLKVPDFKAVLGPPHPVIVHLHAVVMSSWIVFLIVQTSLVAQGRVDLHRRVGMLGFGVACLLVLVGLAATCELLAHLHSPGDPKLRFPFGQVVDLTVFSTLVYFGYRYRFHPDTHKRLMLIATITPLDAAFVRWPILIKGNSLVAEMCCYGLLLLLAGYDLWSVGKVRRATLWGSTLLIIAHHPILTILDQNIAAHRVAIHMQTLGRFLR